MLTMGGAKISLIGTYYFLTAVSDKRMHLLTRLYGIASVHI